MNTIHFFTYCAHELPGDHKSRYKAETTCEPCIEAMLERDLLSERNAQTMRYFIELDRQRCETEQAAVWASIEDGERAMHEMGALR